MLTAIRSMQHSTMKPSLPMANWFILVHAQRTELRKHICQKL